MAGCLNVCNLPCRCKLRGMHFDDRHLFAVGSQSVSDSSNERDSFSESGSARRAGGLHLGQDPLMGEQVARTVSFSAFFGDILERGPGEPLVGLPEMGAREGSCCCQSDPRSV